MDIDKSKENIQPLRGGRDVSRLVPALEAQYDNEMRQLLKQERLEFENRISTYNGPDPLNNWFEYICWTEQSFPKKGHEGSLEQLLRRCLSTFEHSPEYAQDRRMIKLWMKYIDMQEKPTEIYWLLYNQGIGTMCADMYIGWAYYYHAANDFKHARDIFQMGLKALAQPIEDIEIAFRNFQCSFTEYHLSDDPMKQQRSEASLAEQRNALTSLKQYKRKNMVVVASQRIGDHVRNPVPGTMPLQGTGTIPKNNRQLFVYEDAMDGDNLGAAGPSRIPNSILESIRVEENIAEPGPWSKAKGLHPTMQLPTNTPFEVHEDKQTLRFPPCLVDWSEWNPPIFVQDNYAPNAKVMYIKNEVYPAGENKEYSFEEINAAKYFKKLKQQEQASQQQQAIQIPQTIPNQPAQMQMSYQEHFNQQPINQHIDMRIHQQQRQQNQHQIQNQQIQHGQHQQIQNQLQNQHQHQQIQNQNQHQQIQNQQMYQHNSLPPRVMYPEMPKQNYNQMPIHSPYNSRQHNRVPPEHSPHTAVIHPQQKLMQSPHMQHYANQPNMSQYQMHPPNPVSQAHTSYSNHHMEQMANQSIAGNSMTMHSKEIMKEVDNWYGVAPKPYHNQEVHARNIQQHQPLTIYQDSITEQHSRNTPIRTNTQQVYLNERQQMMPQQQHQQYINNENILYDNRPLNNSNNHTATVVEHGYIENHYMATAAQSQRNDLNHVPQPASPFVQQAPTENVFNTTPLEVFNETCSTQAFNANMYKAQISTPVKENASPISPDFVHLINTNTMQNEIEFISPTARIARNPDLSAIMENTRENTQTISGTTSATSLTSPIQNKRPSFTNNLPKSRMTSKLSTLNETASKTTPQKAFADSSQNNLETVQMNPLKCENVIDSRSVTPPTKYTEYRNQCDNSPTPKKLDLDCSIPGTPDNPVLKSAARVHSEFNKPSPNISRSMQNTLHISKQDTGNLTNNKWKMDDSPLTDDYEMDCQEVEEVSDESEKSRSDEIIKRHLRKDIIDPFNSELCEAFLSKVGFPARNNPSCISVQNIPQLKQGTNFMIGPKHYAIEKELGRGAFGSIYRAVDSHTGVTIALKYQKPSRIWEYYICQEIRKRITNNDILPGFMEVSTALVCRSSSILVSEFGKYGSLLNASNKIKQASAKPMAEVIVMYFASHMLSVINHLHKCKIIHGDIKPDNILLMNLPLQLSHIPCIQFIDFGCAIDMSLFPEGTEFRTVVTTDGFTCTEMQEGRPWTYQTDLFCLAGTFHVCLFGEYMKLEKRCGEWNIKTNLPRYYQRHLWKNLFSKLLNISDSKSLPDLIELKSSLDDHLMKNDGEYIDKMRQVANIMNGR